MAGRLPIRRSRAEQELHDAPQRDVLLLDSRLVVREALVIGWIRAPEIPASRRLIERGSRTTQILATQFARTPFAGEDEDVVCRSEARPAWLTRLR